MPSSECARSSTSPQALLSYNIATNTFINYVTETAGDPNSRYSFIYRARVQ